MSRRNTHNARRNHTTNREISTTPCSQHKLTIFLFPEFYNMVRANTNAAQEQRRCPVCKHNHRLLFCRQIRRMEPEERLRAVLLHRHCANCLSSRHMASSCPSTRNCERCQERHHSLLHLREAPSEREDVSLGPNAADVRLNRQSRQHRPYRARALSEEVLEIDANDENLQKVSQDGSQSSEPLVSRPPLSGIRSAVQLAPETRQKGRPRSGQPKPRNLRQPHFRGVRDARERIKGSAWHALGLSVLTPTVVVRVMSRGRTQSVRAIIDPGQPNSTIARTLARRLHALQRHERDYCILTLKGWNERLEIRARVLSSLTKTAPERNVDARVVNEFDNLRLADPEFYRARALY